MDFYKGRTEEWEAVLGDYVRWNYYDRAMFCAIYGRRPGDYNYPWYDVPGDVPSYVRYDPETEAVKVKMTPPEVSDMLMAELKKQRKKKK